ncbi:hypothetical protein PAESOLCIP111_01702 [Paenibacillus solanacearum]|uniref:Uncharacterized protein n=2 Tax=Paenibacillus solanacearum TaxID=2048548 RepID=A0A916NI60_9BACL|nr:hypothetical protein PAESOLCIP111_01702 [Paenibacillus solanacearum]
MEEVERETGRLGKNRYPPARRAVKAGTLLTALLFASIWIGTEASAASFTVGKTDDSAGNCSDPSNPGQCTLRTAIEQSNAAGGANTIRIMPGTYKLTSGQLVISSHITLTGADGNATGDASATVIEGDGSHRLFEIQPGVNAAFQALTLQGGKAAPDASGYGGGGVAVKLGAGNTLTFTNAVIRNNMTTTSANPGYGGGVYVSGPATAKLMLTSTTFNANVAGERGGGLYAEGDLDIEADQATFVSNTASKQLGGGMAVLSATPASGTIAIRNSLFDSNAAQGVSDDGIGGGLYLNAPAIISGTTFKGNTANSDGGGLFLSFFQKVTSLTNVEFLNNTSSSGYGGGLFVQNGNPALTNTTFAGNQGGASSPEFGAVASPVEPFSPAAPMKTSDGAEYKGGEWTAQDVTVAGVDVSLNNGAAWNPGPASFTTEGTHKIVYKQADNTGNAVLQTKSIQIDKTKPTLTADITSDNAAYTDGTWAAKDVTITVSAQDQVTLSGLKSVKYSFNEGAAWSDYSVPLSLTADGTYSLQVQAADQAGNLEEKSYTIKLDKTAPALTVDWKTSDNQPYIPGTWTTLPVTLSAVSSDSGSGLARTQYSLNGGATWTDYTEPVTVSAEGAHDVRIQASDQAGNTVTRNGAVQIDQTAPQTTAVLTKEDNTTYASGEWSKQAVTLNASFMDSGSDLNQKLYSLNEGATWLNYTAPLNFQTDGTHEVWLKGIDNAGLEDTHRVTIQIDTAAPALGAAVETASGTNYPVGTWSTDKVTLTLNPSDAGGSGLAVTQYSLDDGASWTDYTIPVTVTDGVYAVRARTSDHAGNTADGSWSVKVDTVHPSLALGMELEGDRTPYIDNTWASEPVVLKLNASDIGGSGLAVTQYSLNGGTLWTDYTSPVTVTDGVYHVSGKAVDAAGNTTVRNAQINIDRLQPDLSVTMTAAGTPYVSGTWTTNDVTVEAAADSGASVRSTTYSLDGGSTWAEYTGPIDITAEGQTVISFKTVNEAGRQTQKQAMVNISRTAPAIVVTQTPNAVTRLDVNVSVTASAYGKEAGNTITALRYAQGTQSAAYFSGGDGIDLTAGTASFTATDNGTFTVYAKDAAGNEAVQEVTVTQIIRDLPELQLTASPLGLTNRDVTVTVTATVYGTDRGNALTQLKWAEGSRSTSDFAGSGTDLNVDGGVASFTAADNGVYTVYAKDAAGNEAVQEVTVTQIIRDLPELQLTASPSGLTNGDVTVSVTATVYGTDRGNALTLLKWAEGSRGTSDFAGSGTDLNIAGGVASFTATTNGAYTVYAKDTAGNETVQEVTVTQIIRDLPGLQLTVSPSGPTSGNVTVSVTATVYGTDRGNALTQLKWAEGSRSTSDFAGSGTDLSTAGGTASFTVATNGAYTVYAKDAAGNESVQEVTVTQIIRDLPVLQLTASPSGPTSGDVTVTVTATVYGTDRGNVLTQLKWAEGNRDRSYFAGSGAVLNAVGGTASFTATTNGAYTVYAKDAAGSEAVQTIQIANIHRTAPSIELAVAPVGAANEQAKITVTASVYGAGNSVSVIKWAQGSRDTGYFDRAGNDITPAPGEAAAFIVNENGMYTVYVKDALGHASIRTVTVTSIIRPGAGNQPPVAGQVQLNVAADSVGYGTLEGHDPDGDGVTFDVSRQGTRGALEILNVHTGAFKYTPRPGMLGTDTVTYAVYDSLAAVGYGTVQVTIVPKGTPSGPSNRADLVSLHVSAGSLIPAFHPDVYHYSVSVPNEVNATTVTAVVYDSLAALTVNGMKATSGSASPLLPLQSGTNSIAVVVTAADGTTVQAYVVTVYREPQPPGPGDSDSSSPSGSDGETLPAEPPKDDGLTGDWNGTPVEHLGTVTTEIIDGKTVVTATLDTERIEEQLKQSTEPPTLIVRVEGSADRVEAVLNGSILEMLADRQAVLQVQSGLGNYALPLAGLPLDSLMAQLGSQANLSDIVLRIVIAEAPEQLVERIHNRAQEGQYTVVMPPIDFTVEAVYQGRTIEIREFQRMVSREIPIPPEVDASRITTAVVAMADGTVYHVPTSIITREGKSYLRINSLTNSTYAAISHMKTFADLAGHWARLEVNNMASRMIVNGVTDQQFSPDAPVTRAQFTAMIIRALGLSEHAAAESRYRDVLPTDWFEGAVAQAKAYGLIDGYEDGTFRPDRSITRQEALVIIARAMKLAGKPVELTAADPQSILSGFKDSGEVNEWALREAAEAVQSGLVQGSQEGLLPQSQMTRAETAVILYRLLVQSQLIDPQ